MLLVEILNTYNGDLIIEFGENTSHFKSIGSIPDEYFHKRISLISIVNNSCLKIQLHNPQDVKDLESLGYSFDFGV